MLEVRGSVLTGNDISNTDVATNSYLQPPDGAQPDASGGSEQRQQQPALDGNVVGLQNDDPDPLTPPATGGVIAAGQRAMAPATGLRSAGMLHLSHGIRARPGPAMECVELTLCHTAIDFGNVLINTTATRNFNVENTGDADVTLAAVRLSAVMLSSVSSAERLQYSNLAPGETCQVVLEFAPLLAQNFSADLEVLSDLASSPTLVPVSGIGVAPVITADPTAVNFPGTVINGTASASVNVSNTGAGGLDISGLTLTGMDPGAFAITFEDCIGSTLLAGESCTVNLDFNPASIQNFDAVLAVQSNASNGELQVALTGAGLANEADLTITAEPLDPFGELGAEFGYIVVVANDGPADVTAADVTSTLATGLDNVTWACSADTGAACPASGPAIWMRWWIWPLAAW